jgi:peptidoglycan/xylan/chitin deacetylase (PgdA/CDA1 family)
MIAVTIDDLPFVRIESKTNRVLIGRTVDLLSALEKLKAPATGFVKLSKVYNELQLDSTRFNLLRLWLIKGFDLGNHTFSHPDYNKAGYSYFINDLEKNEPFLNKLMKENGKTMVFFRHPYLHRGNSKANILFAGRLPARKELYRSPCYS